ncbi:uncharacterized protein LOC114916341 [Cajanus cajan]|uniref:uncharacterized protein LOC114916341 n=1 Tax=Cajanus cajan TaxID=3821 RepID=UPI0010FB62F1|nr:uncharacterized protein LOC114916341 [Cajanus cajan]
MAKVPHIQEFSKLESDTRKKLDGFIKFSNGEKDDTKEENVAKKDLKSLESDLKFDLRKSLAWDSAFSTCSGFLEAEELFHASNSWDNENDCDILVPEQAQLLSCNYLKPETKSFTGVFNLRKSLDWDSAFFTSEGILDHAELSRLNKGFKKSEIDILPPIQELRISSESNCTIDSEVSSLATLEISTNQFGEASNTVASSFRNIQHSTKKTDGDCIPKLKVKSISNLRRPNINGNQPGRSAKESSIRPSCKFSASSGISDLSSSLKPPKLPRRVRRNATTAPTNRVPLFSNESKTVKPSGKCLMEKSNLSKTCSDDNSSCTTLSWDFSSLSSKSCMNGSKGLNSPSYKLSPWQSSSKVSNPCSLEKGSNSVSFDSSRTAKPSGLRMPSPKIGFFDMDNFPVSIENTGNKSNSKALSKTQSGQILKDVRNIRTCAWNNKSTISRNMKFGSRAVSNVGEAKDCMRNEM